MTVFTSRVRRAYLRRRSIGELVIFGLFVVASVALLAVAACESEQPPPVVDAAEVARRQEIVRSWYAEVYPAYVVSGR